MARFLFVVFLIITSTSASAQGYLKKISPANTVRILPTDTKEEILLKAVHVVPTANQYEALKDEFIAFIHFGPNTFTRMEWGTGREDPKIFNLDELHTDQWCAAMKAAGMTKVILTVKHHDGFVLWQSRYTTHGIMSTEFKNGRGDVLKELSASCKKYGLRLGIYLSPADLFQIENPQGLYGNLSKYTMRTIPRAVPGKPFKSKTRFKFLVDDYNEYFLNQLFELLTEYGPVHELWFDGAHPKTKGGQQYNYGAWEKLIRTLAPNAVIFGRGDIRWCGNEGGRTRTTEWNVIPFLQNPDTIRSFPDLTADNIGDRENLYRAHYLHYQPAETNTSIREGWFYRDDTYQKVRSAEDVFDIYERSVGGNSIFLLNIPPNREGKFSATDVAVLEETGRRIRDTYGRDLFINAKGLRRKPNQDAFAYTMSEEKVPQIVITSATPVTINRLVLQEAIKTHGERVEQHALDAWINHEWKEIASATNIGYKRILRFEDVESTKFRIRFTASRAAPMITAISAHWYKSRPPRLTISRSANGMVSILPVQDEFKWKPHGQDAVAAKNRRFEIFYTTDGSEPDVRAKKYTAPFKMGNGEVKAVAIANDETGAIASKRLGLLPADWKLLNVSSESAKHSALLAFDANVSTWWQSEASGSSQFISIDLGKMALLRGFAYTPQSASPNGMMEKGKISISKDGENWQTLEDVEFGNLINDPTTRYHYFNTPVKTKFIRIESERIAGGDKRLSIAELEFFE